MKPTILLVEDNPLDLELTAVALERCAIPHLLYVARDGEEALDFLLGEDRYSRSVRPSVILLDLKLPKIDGIELLKRIRFTPSLSDLPVVVLSSSNEEADRQRTEALGAVHYLVKPMQWEGFSETLARVLGPLI